MAQTPDVFEHPMSVTAIEGRVTITGPDGMVGTLTPQAARDSARRLLEAADDAEGGRGRRVEDDAL